MLQADKQLLLAGVKRNALGLRQRELEFNVERYTNLATQASVIAGFSFESLVELEVPEGTHWLLSSVYFVFGSSAMALSLYVLCVASFGVVFGHRLALQGPHGSLERAVTILISHRLHLFSVAGMALACLVLAAVCMSWIKMGAAAAVVSGIFVAFFVAVAWRLRLMAVLFDIPLQQLVTGAVTVAPPNQPAHAGLDLSHLNPGARAAAASSSYQRSTYGGNAVVALSGSPSTNQRRRDERNQPPRSPEEIEIQPAADGHSLSAASTGSASAACEKKSSMGRENEPRNPPRPGEKACPAPPCGAASLTSSSFCFDTLKDRFQASHHDVLV